jgi:HEAT repeat protein
VAQKEGGAREEALLNVVRTDPDAEVRSQAVFWLSSIESERATEILEELLRGSTDDRVRDRAIYALSAQKSPRARAALRDFASRADAPTQLRSQAIYWLGQHTDAEGVEYLRRLYASLDDPSLKERVLFTLSQTKGVGNEQWLMQRVQDANETPALRGRALFHLGQGGLLPTAELAALYDRLTERQVKEQAIFALAQRGDTASVDKLMDIVRRERERALRERALFWLGQSKDPRVPAFLLEVIDR